MNSDAKLQKTINRFKNPKRTNKDEIERELTRAAFEGTYGGSVLTLTGPAIERHVKIYAAYFSAIIVVETDRQLAEVLKAETNGFRRKYAAHIFVHPADIFEYEHAHHLPPVRLVDLDFTNGWNRDLEDRILVLIDRYPDAGLRITYNARSPYTFERIAEVREKTHEIPYRAVRAGTGDPMVTAQFRQKL